jgi:outer membrane biosynthesis protein TonB
MFIDRTLRLAFTISVATHLVVIAQGSLPLLITSTSQRPKKIEINYIKPIKEQKPEEKTSGSPSSKKEALLLKTPTKIGGGKRIPPPFFDKDESARVRREVLRNDIPLNKPVLMRPEAIVIKKKVSLPAVDLAKIDNPSYISYYQIVREKIRRSAYQNYSSNETGEAYITFIISEGGLLKDVHLVEEKSSASENLREIALTSVINASPFPRFPKELDYPQLSFNVVISFEVE